MKQQILIKLWPSQLNSDSSDINELKHDVNALLQQVRVIINMHVSVTLLAKTLTAQSKWMALNPERQKSPNESLFKVIGAQTERNKFYKCPSCRVAREKFYCATRVVKKLVVEYNE